MDLRKPVAILLVLSALVSLYFTGIASAQAPSPIGPPLSFYQLGADGKMVAASVNVFSAGQEIWVGVPNGASPSYTLTISNAAGVKIWSQQNSSFPAEGLISLSLAPAIFSLGQSYTMSLQVMKTYSPGFFAPQTSRTSFTVVPAFANLLLKTYSFTNSGIEAQTLLEDGNENPVTGVRIGLFLVQGNSSLQITTEKTDLLGRVSLKVGKSLAGGNYQLQLRVLDSNAVFASSVQLPRLTVNPVPTSLTAWNSTNGQPEALLTQYSGTPVPGRLLVLEKQLKDGNWTILTTSYTDTNGLAPFSTNTPLATWRVVFSGDGFYGPSRSDSPSTKVDTQSGGLASQPQPAWSSFVGYVFTNGHIVLKIGPSTSTIYDSQGQAVLGHLSWEIQSKDNAGAWQELTWDGPLSLTMDDPSGSHRVTLSGTAGTGQVAISMSFVAKPHDAPFTTLQMPVDVQALRGSGFYRMILRLEGVSASFFQFEERTGDQRTVVRGPLAAGVEINQSPMAENSMVALAADRNTILFGLNWDHELQYYQGTSLGSGSSGTTANIRFGDVALATGQHWIIPEGPHPDGGGGGGGTGTVPTTTTTILPSSAYATVPAILTGLVRDLNGNPVSGGYVWWVDNSSKVLGSAFTNSTGYATMVWTPGAVAVHTINADFAGSSVYANSYGNTLTLNVQKTPTTIQLLQPQQIAYSWDLYNYYKACCNGYGLPIVVPVNILTVSPSNNTSPANIYMPAYSGASSVPPHVSGYGWAGLNLTSAVTVAMNGTYTQTQNMNRTQNFYLPPCPSPPNCSTTPRTGHIYLTATLAPPSTLYSSSSTTLNIPFQDVNSVSTSSNQVLQSATPPAHLYINVNASYPYLSVTMQGLPVSLAMYNAYLAYTLGAPTSSFLSSGYTFYALTGSTDFAYVCTDSTCSTPAANVAVYLYDYNSKGNLVYCGIYSPTNNRGIAYVVGNGSKCGYPYAYAAIYTSGNTLAISELFHIEAVSNPSPFLTNFQGYNYAVYAPQKTGRYLLDMRTLFLNSAYTVLNPTASYPDVQYPYNSCCDVFLTVQKHPLQAQTSFNPATITILNKTNATIALTDLATSSPLSSSMFNYTLTRNDPSTGTVLSGILTTNANGTATLSLGVLGYGNYTLSVSRSATSILNNLLIGFQFTVYKALPLLILRNTSAFQTANPNVIKFMDPSGTSTTPSIVLSSSSPYRFYAIIGTSTDLLSTPPGVTATCLANLSNKNCVQMSINYGTTAWCAQKGCLSGHQGQVITTSWTNGLPSGTVPCAQSTFTNCSQTVTRLTGSSNICGTNYCTEFSVFVGSLDAVQGYWLFMYFGVYDSSSNNYISPPNGFGFVASPNGLFLVNGMKERPADAAVPLGSAVSFQFNATSSPNSITSVTLSIFNQTSSTSTSICLIGGSGCIQSAQTTTGAFLLYAPSRIVFSPGAYIVTITFTCPSCAQTTIQVLSLVLLIPQGAWIQNAVAGNTYSFEASLVNNATGTQVNALGLSENVYINGVLYASLQTDSVGNTAFTWTPSTAGQYNVTVIFYRQSYYPASQTTAIVSVAHRSVILAESFSPQNPDVGQRVTWSILAHDLINNATVKSLQVSQYIDGVLKATNPTDSSGTASFTYSFSSTGSYSVTFVSAMNATYSSATIKSSINVFLETSLTLQGGPTIILGQQNTFTLTLRDSGGSPLPSRTIQITINGGFYQNVTTSSNGQAQFSWRPDNTGSYSLTASFSPTNSADFGYKPSSNGFVISVLALSTVNTQSTSSGTQSVSLSTAQGSTQSSIPLPSISFGFPDPFTATVNVNFNGKTGEASSHLSNAFGWNCYWWGCLPYWNVNIDSGVSGVFSLHIGGAGLGIATSASVTVNTGPPTDFEAFQVGALTSLAIAVAGIVLITQGPEISALYVGLLMGLALGAGVVPFGTGASFRSYLLGLFLPVLAAVQCLFLACPGLPDVLGAELLTAAYAWVTYEEVMFRIMWSLGGFLAAVYLGIVMAMAGLLIFFVTV